MMVLLFESLLRVDADERNCRATCARMMEPLEKIPGFLFDTYACPSPKPRPVAKAIDLRPCPDENLAP